MFVWVGDVKEVALILSTVATTIAIISFCGTTWRLWRDRPRLRIYCSQVIFKNLPDKREHKMLQIKVCNIGFRPIILTECLFVGEKSSFHMGIHDEPAAAYGISDQKFPSIIGPGKTIDFHPIGIDAIKNNMTDPHDSKTFFDPYLFVFLVDSFGRFHHINMDDVKWSLHLNLSGRRARKTRWGKLTEYFQRRRLQARIKKEKNW